VGAIIAGDTIVNGPAAPKDFASAMATAFYVGAGTLAVAFVLAHFLMPADKQADIE
jgi:hypothetical protein